MTSGGAVGRIAIFALAYAAAEWLRGHLFSGFPWNLPAYGWAALPAILQSTSVFGAYGLTLLTILFGASLVVLTEARARHWLIPAAVTAVFAYGQFAIAIASSAKSRFGSFIR